MNQPWTNHEPRRSGRGCKKRLYRQLLAFLASVRCRKKNNSRGSKGQYTLGESPRFAAYAGHNVRWCTRSYRTVARQRGAPESNFFIVQQKQITFREKVVLYLEKVGNCEEKVRTLANEPVAGEKRKFSWAFLYVAREKGCRESWRALKVKSSSFNLRRSNTGKIICLAAVERWRERFHCDWESLLSRSPFEICFRDIFSRSSTDSPEDFKLEFNFVSVAFRFVWNPKYRHR